MKERKCRIYGTENCGNDVPIYTLRVNQGHLILEVPFRDSWSHFAVVQTIMSPRYVSKHKRISITTDLRMIDTSY